MISNQNKFLGIEQWSHTDRLADLWSFIHDAEIKSATCENRMLDAHTGGCHYQLDRERGSILNGKTFSQLLRLQHVQMKSIEEGKYWHQMLDILKIQKSNADFSVQKFIRVRSCWDFNIRQSNLLVVKLLQLWQRVNSFLPHAFLCVRQDVWMNLGGGNTTELRASQTG